MNILIETECVRVEHKQVGFTLLELLIAMTLMGLVLGLLYGGLRLGARSWDAGEQRAEQFNEMQAVHDFIRSQIRQSLEVFRYSQQGRVLAFEGESQRLLIVAPMFEHLGRGGLYYIEFNVLQDVDGDALQMRWYPFQPGDPDERKDSIDMQDAEKTILLSEVADVKWAYFGIDAVGEKPDWFDEWDNPLQSPILVRLSLSVREGVWPDLVVRLTN